MASAPALPLVSVDEYLNASYEQDMEYVDDLVRGMPTIAHNLLERILLFWIRTIRTRHAVQGSARSSYADHRTSPISHPGCNALPEAVTPRQSLRRCPVGG